MKRHHHSAIAIVFSVIIFLMLPSDVHAGGYGTVTEVAGDDVVITLEEGTAERSDLVRVTHVTSGGIEIEAGTWIVTGVTGKTVAASPQNRRVAPRVGMKASFSTATTADRSLPESVKDLPAPANVATETSDIEDLAAAGNASAQHRLGWMYQHGQGMEKDPATAVYWYEKAAEQNYLPAQNDLGWMYQQGLGVAQDLNRAVFWYRKAADRGFPPAQDNMGWMYQHGLGVPQDDATAFAWYKAAAEQGHANAQNNAGYCYFNGIGAVRDLAAALSWYRKAAEQDHPRAQFNLGINYYYGQGVAEDRAEGLLWLRKAAAAGNQPAVDELAKLGERW